MRLHSVVLLLAALGMAPLTVCSQGLLKKIKNKAAETVNKVTSKGSGSTGESSSGGEGNAAGDASERDPSEGGANTGGGGAEKLPGGGAMSETTLATLNKGEYIIANESSLRVGKSGNGYTIIIRSGNEFYALTESGKKGPFKVVPAELLPKQGTLSGGIYSYEAVKPNSQRDLGYTMEGKVLIKHEGQVLLTLPAGTQYMGHFYASEKKELTYVTLAMDGEKMTATIHQPSPAKELKIPTMMAQILQDPVSKELLYSYAAEDVTEKYFLNSKGAKTGPYPHDSRAYSLPGGTDYIVMVPGADGKGSKVFRDGKLLYELPEIGYEDAVIFNSDASAYCVVSSGGLRFSDGSRVSTGIAPAVEKTASGSKLHFLRVNANKEVIHATIPW